MSQVRVPATAEPLLPFCRPFHDRRDNAFFESYAEMLVFAAGVGYAKSPQKRPSTCSDFLDQPYPIPTEYFKSLQLFPIMLLLALAATKDHRVAKDEKRLAAILEDYANLGMRELGAVLKNTTPEEMHVDVARFVVDAADAIS